ncbi:esterase-like activity of phytase family protein [Erythrobacter rubeus]|uniref:Esterase-like activity of phytase family protein n=1 Tax=Erythrobacter rubeus TaxID=2760803 RepID=A0ABR8KXG6_9SPHN|nr:esterase-like activity of phytase family protein [Erythrobacter rubeus]MBD2843139.1 esterase-like activity of phytase family protein [Erythrobacter rubeus]
MRSARRALAAIILAILCAPGTWLRTPGVALPPQTIELSRIQGDSRLGGSAWRVAGVWHYAADSVLFGGFSALIAADSGRLQAFSDRGGQFSFAEPDQPSARFAVKDQPIASARVNDRRDIEAAAIDPETGDYWLAMEQKHSVHRFDSMDEPKGVRVLDNRLLGWSNNGGAEAMTRLSDGRFILLPEGGQAGLLFSGDPVAGAEFETIPYRLPVRSYAATDMAQMPDGRILLLLRSVSFSRGLPSFNGKIAIADVPDLSTGEVWSPRIIMDFAELIPRENYEGLAVRPRADGTLAVWLISDDNFSVLQRTLLAKMVFDPSAK